MSFSSNTTDSDDLLHRSMMGWLYVDPPMEFSLSDQSNGDTDNNKNQNDLSSFYKEESELEAEIIEIIHSPRRDMLKPNSGHSVTVRGHSLCFTMIEEMGTNCREWEWHGFIRGYDHEYRYFNEYTYGCYTERFIPEKLCDADDENLEGKGLGLFDGNVSSGVPLFIAGLMIVMLHCLIS